jgi:putative PIN family toxin of toxin-antitoxin system
MRRALLDTTVLVSAFLNPVTGGVSVEVIRLASVGAFELYLSEYILDETAGVLLRQGRHRKRFVYSDADVTSYCENLRLLSIIVDDLPAARVVRDPADDRILAAALRAKAGHLVSRDNDLLVLGKYDDTEVVTPEAFLAMLRND